MPEPRTAIQLPSLLERFPDPLFVIDSTGRICAVNAAAIRFSGYALQPLLGLTARDLLSPESHAALLALAGEVAEPFTLTVDWKKPSGENVTVDLYGSVGEGGLLQTIVRESAERHRHSELRFRFMAKNLSEMVLAYDMERRLTFVNAATQTLTGYSAEELERAQFINWVHPDDRTRMLGYWDRLFEGKGFHDEEYRLVTRDGRVKWVAATWGPILNDEGQQIGVQGREREITERRMAEETLRQSSQQDRESEERYRTLFEDSPFPMWEEDFSQVKQYLAELKRQGVTDLRAHFAAQHECAAECLRRIRVVDVNRAARDFYGAETKEELLGGLDEFFDEAAWENFREEIVALDATNSMYKSEFQTRTIAGDERSVSMIVSLAASPEDWSRVIVSFFDITDRKRLEEQLLQSQKMESLGRLAGGIAHDFNNLLMVILGYSDLLLSSATESSVARGLGEIKAAGERGIELTEQLLAFSRKRPTQPRPLHLNALILESHGMLRRLIGEDIQLELSLAPDAWTIRADRGQIHQAILNLVVHAREAMPDGGLLTLTTRNISEPAGGESLLLEVRDTGAGMDESTKSRIFEPFFSSKNRRHAAGLGMSTVFGVVIQAGGHILVDSELGKGSCFRLYFPRDAAALEPEVAKPSAPAFSALGNVLLVEDEPEVREVASRMLRNLGLSVLEAANGEAALALAGNRAHAIDLLLTDVIMPGMNGRDLASRFSVLRPGTKVAFMSGYTGRLMNEAELLDSTVVLLRKPFKQEDLARVVAEALGPVR